jgi:hypothetical protein
MGCDIGSHGTVNRSSQSFGEPRKGGIPRSGSRVAG